jgi:hypothetical protein
MLNILGIKLHPAVGIVVGAALIVIALVLARPLLAVAGAAMVVAAVSHRHGGPPAPDAEPADEVPVRRPR